MEKLGVEEGMIDFKSKLGRKAMRHLIKEYFVWFILEDDTLLMYSQPGAFKLKHIINNPKVSLHFNTPDPKGESDVIVFSGIAKIDTRAEAVNKNSLYLRKYRTGIKELGSTPQQFTQAYSTAVRIKLSSLRGW